MEDKSAVAVAVVVDESEDVVVEEVDEECVLLAVVIELDCGIVIVWCAIARPPSVFEEVTSRFHTELYTKYRRSKSLPDRTNGGEGEEEVEEEEEEACRLWWWG